MQELNEQQLQNFKKAFELFDKDNSGSISRDEIRQVFRQLHIKVSQTQLQKIIHKFDKDGDNSIQFQQFLMVVAATFDQPQCQQWIYQVFQTIDQDCDGMISKQQLMKIQQKQISMIMEEGDPLCQGGLSYEDFKRIILLNQK